MDEETAVIKILAIPEDDPDPPVFWLDDSSPFIGQCAYRAARDPQWAEKAAQAWWSEDGRVDYKDDSPAEKKFSRYSEGIHGRGHGPKEWPSAMTWFCMCGKRVQEHPHG